jgi:membrane protease YdiL (CAAX protease family)
MILRGGVYLVIGFVLLFVFAKIIDKENFIFSKWFSLKNRCNDFFKGGLLGSVCVVIAFVVPAIVNWNKIAVIPFEISLLLSSFFMMFCIVLLEECVFRGYLLRQLLTRFSPLVSLLISAGLFALPHILFLDFSSAFIVLIAIAGYSLGSILLGLLYLKTQNIWLAIGFHLSWNYTQQITGMMEYMPTILQLNFEHAKLFDPLLCIVLIASVVFYYKKIKLYDYKSYQIKQNHC